MSEDHDYAAYFEHGSVEKDSADTVKWTGSCTVCGRGLVEVYDYQGTYDVESEQWIRQALDETTQQLHDLLGKVITYGRAGEWREAVDAKTELEDDLHTLVIGGGS